MGSDDDGGGGDGGNLGGSRAFPSDSDLGSSFPCHWQCGDKVTCFCYCWQADTNVLNVVISTKLRVARFTSTLWQSYEIREIRLTEKIGFVEVKVFVKHIMAS